MSDLKKYIHKRKKRDRSFAEGYDEGYERMSTQTLNPTDIRKVGLQALAKALGPLGMGRFLQQYESGIGDYTKERNKWLKDFTVKSIVKEIKNRRKP